MTAAIDDPLRVARLAVQAGRFREAWALLDAQAGPVRRSAEWLLLTAIARWRLGDFGSSRSAALQARDRYRALGDSDGEMRAENVAAAGAFGLGAMAEAERGFTRALELATGRRDELMMARCANNVGNVQFYLGQHAVALSYYRVAGARFDKVGFDYGVAETMINTGIVWRDLGNLRESQVAAERALEKAEQYGTWRLAAQALAMRGEARGLLGDLPLGKAQVNHALQVARDHEDREAETESLRILCNLHRVAGELEAGRQRGEEALALANTLGHPISLAEVHRDLGDLYQVAGRTADAVRCWEHAADGFTRLGAEARGQALREKARAGAS